MVRILALEKTGVDFFFKSVCISLAYPDLYIWTDRINVMPFIIINSAGTSPTFWTRGLAALGLAGTRGLAGPIEDLPSFEMSSFLASPRVL